MKKVWLFSAAVLSALVLAACDEPNKQQLDPQPAAAAPARVDDADLAVKADFEADAEQSISTASYKQDLDAAEKELSGK